MIPPALALTTERALVSILRYETSRGSGSRVGRPSERGVDEPSRGRGPGCLHVVWIRRKLTRGSGLLHSDLFADLS